MTARHSGKAPAAARGPRLAAWLAAHPFWASACLYVVALGLRLLYLRDFRRSVLARVPMMDEAFYRAEAWNLLRGAPPASDAPFMTPLYPHFLSVVFRILGDGPAAAPAVQLVLGALAAPLTYLLARRALPEAWAIVAGLGVASFAPIVFFEALLLVEGLVLLGFLSAVTLAAVRPQSARFALAAGACLGIATLGRGSNLLLAPVVGAAFLGPRGRAGARRLGAFALGFLVVLAPLLARNAARTGRPFLLTANAGFNLYVGNGPEATGIFVVPRGLDLERDPLTLLHVQRAKGHPVSASETSDYWAQQTRDWVRKHPGRTVELFVWKLLLFWNRLSIPQVEGFDGAASGTALARAPYWRSFAFLPLGLVGLLLAFAGWRPAALSPAEAARRRALRLVAACTFVYSLSIALFFVTDRYRVPTLPLVMILAAATAAAGARWTRRDRRRRLLGLAPLVGLAFFLTSPDRLPLDIDHMQSRLHVHTAMRYEKDGDLERALAERRAALRLKPRDPELRSGLARMLSRTGRDSLARRELETLVRDEPRDATAWLHLGDLHRKSSRLPEAVTAYGRALEIEPQREAAWNNLGETYRLLGDTARAGGAYRRALGIVPAYDRALNNLAMLHLMQGRAAEAEAGFRAALSANPRYLPALVNLAIIATDAGRTAEALELWRRILSLDPEHETARTMVRDLGAGPGRREDR